MVLGLTGKYCAGKNQVAARFEERGYRVIDVDRLGHEALKARKSEVLAAFGEGILGPEGEIDRKALGGIVFKDKNKLRLLESLVHPWMRDRVAETVKANPGGKTIVNAALLFPMRLDGLCDRIIVVEAPLCLRILRARKRDRQSYLRILRRILSQRKLIPQPSFRPADTISMENRGTPEELGTLVEAVLSRLPG